MNFSSVVRKAFTLLEVIIAMTLVSLLMTVVWSLFSTYTRLENRSTRTAIELQLVRSVSQQLRSDLEHFAVVAVPPNVVHQENANQGDVFTPKDKGSDESDRKRQGQDVGYEESSDNELATEEDPYSQSIDEVSGTNASQFAPVNDIDLLNANQTFTSSLPQATYIRGTATRLELVTRLPYTVDIPTGRQLLGAESRYGTFQLVVFQWSDERDLASLLREDPVLNPSTFNPLSPPVLPLHRNQPPPAPEVAKPLNPNDNIGLVREAKSWLHATRDRRIDDLKQQFESAGLLVSGEVPLPDPQLNQVERFPSQIEIQPQGPDDGAVVQAPWSPPPEFRHKKDHIPEVTRLQFRYHNGETWQLEWSNEVALPVAVEIAFDVDADAPAVRAKQFEAAHALMVGGASLSSVLPDEEDVLPVPVEASLDPLVSLNLEDPTAIVTEYRFVIALPNGPVAEDREANGEVEVDAVSPDSEDLR